jgi:hypothetical protein
MLSTAGSTSFNVFPLQKNNDLSSEKVSFNKLVDIDKTFACIDNLFGRRKLVA